MASSRAALWAAAVDGGFSKGEAFVSQMPDGKNPENPGFSWALSLFFNKRAPKNKFDYRLPVLRRLPNCTSTSPALSRVSSCWLRAQRNSI